MIVIWDKFTWTKNTRSGNEMKRIQSLKPHLTLTMRFGIITFIPI